LVRPATAAISLTTSPTRPAASDRLWITVWLVCPSLAARRVVAEAVETCVEISRTLAESCSVASVQAMAAAVAEIDVTSSAIAAAVEQQATATQEIARTVSQAADTAREVATRIGEVSSANVETGRRANSVRDAAAEARFAIAELKGVLVRVVRTATPEVNRRASLRFDLQRRVSISVAGQPAQAAQLLDISLGGARIDGASPLSAGSRGTLHIDGLARPLAFVTIGGVRGALRVRFELDEAAQLGLAQILTDTGVTALQVVGTA
jgi:hypothetical protein